MILQNILKMMWTLTTKKIIAFEWYDNNYYYYNYWRSLACCCRESEETNWIEYKFVWSRWTTTVFRRLRWSFGVKCKCRPDWDSKDLVLYCCPFEYNRTFHQQNHRPSDVNDRFRTFRLRFYLCSRDHIGRKNWSRDFWNLRKVGWYGIRHPEATDRRLLFEHKPNRPLKKFENVCERMKNLRMNLLLIIITYLLLVSTARGALSGHWHCPWLLPPALLQVAPGQTEAHCWS